jgi:hypothetical protein
MTSENPEFIRAIYDEHASPLVACSGRCEVIAVLRLATISRNIAQSTRLPRGTLATAETPHQQIAQWFATFSVGNRTSSQRT